MPLWARVLLPLVVLGVALLIGSGAFDSSPETVAQRAAGIEAGVRCPSCTDLSVAQSNATTAIAVRHQIESMVASGSSTADIDQTLVSEYGQTILLVPPDAGGFPLLWVIPSVLGAGAAPRRRRPVLAPQPPVRRPACARGGAMTADPSTSVRSHGDSGRDERWYLADEQDFLHRSLEDARREHEAGDLSDEDYELLAARDSARLAEVDSELAALGPEPRPDDASASSSAGSDSDPDPDPDRIPISATATTPPRGRRCRCGASSASRPPACSSHSASCSWSCTSYRPASPVSRRRAASASRRPSRSSNSSNRRRRSPTPGVPRTSRRRWCNTTTCWPRTPRTPPRWPAPAG